MAIIEMSLSLFSLISSFFGSSDIEKWGQCNQSFPPFSLQFGIFEMRKGLQALSLLAAAGSAAAW